MKGWKKMHNIVEMLRYIGCEPFEEAYNTLHFWTFVQNLAEGYEKYRGLTDKQYEALCKIVVTRTSCTVKPKGWQKSRRNGGSDNVKKKVVDHNYTDLITIALYELPFESGTTVILDLEPYNKDRMVCNIGSTTYLIHRPDVWEPITAPITIECKYRRTKYKGFLERV